MRTLAMPSGVLPFKRDSLRASSLLTDPSVTAGRAVRKRRADLGSASAGAIAYLSSGARVVTTTVRVGGHRIVPAPLQRVARVHGARIIRFAVQKRCVTLAHARPANEV